MSENYYHTKASVDEYIQMAEGYNGGELIEIFKKFLPAESDVLELGSGPGTDWKLLDTHFSVVGSDNSKEFLKRLIESIPDGKFLELDASTLQTRKTFDGIYSNKVLHHLKDEELQSSIERQYEILNDGGIICHSFWEGEGSEVFKGLFVNYHYEAELNKLLEDKFEILHLEKYKEFEEDDSIFLVARKK
ncbi:MAG: class I SAM-dependent methyltransferase [Cyclobacteriaceae bacterium]